MEQISRDTEKLVVFVGLKENDARDSATSKFVFIPTAVGADERAELCGY